MGRKKRQRKPPIEEDTSNLPCEVIFIILTKLPVKSLLRFRCVCKPWRSLISESHFIKSHLTESIKSDRQKLLFSASSCDSFWSIELESSFDPQQLHFPIQRYPRSRVLCSCSGLVLFGIGDDKMYVLWNPSTRTYKKFSCPYPINSYATYYGICYNSSTDDYKVVFLPWKLNNKSSCFVVYTFKTNNWTDIREFPLFPVQYAEPNNLGGLAINGAPHWVLKIKTTTPTVPKYSSGTSETSSSDSSDTSQTSSSDDTIVEGNKLISTGMNRPKQSYRHDCDNNYVIVYFDSVEETFKEVPPPYWLCEGDVFGLTVIRGRLSLYISANDFKLHEIWTMKEYSERNSWSKLFSIPRAAMHGCSVHPKTLCSTQKDEIVILYYSVREIVLYNPKENRWRIITPSKTGMRYFSSLVSHVDSLVLLPTRNKLTKMQRQKRQGVGKGKGKES